MSAGAARLVAADRATRAAWTGRVDGDAADVRRWHQEVRFVDLATEALTDAVVAASEAAGGAGALCFVGYASDEGVRRNLGRTGAAAGPAELRRRMAPLAAVEGVALLDAGDVAVDPSAGGDPVADAQRVLADAVEAIARAGALPVVLGGGHDQAHGLFLGLAAAIGAAPACVNFDAHLDLREIPAEGPHSGTPFTQSWEWCRAREAPFRYCALGVQRAGNTRRLLERAEFAGATVVDADGFALDHVDVVMDAVNDAVDEGEIALSIDLDVFAAAFAPGVSAPSAMGIAPDAAFRRILRGLLASGRVKGVEIAELNPSLDVDGRTARLGAALVHEIALACADAAEDGR
ncbi:MAG: hypothetical protein RI967_76 [Planctomycetota bacterium]